MFLRLLALFTLVPLVELFLLMEVGSRLGLLPTIALVLFTGALGAALARSQGVRVLRQVQAETARGGLPTEALLEGLMIFVAGAVLLTPGLLTDFAGFFLLVPAGRTWVRRRVQRWLKGRVRTVVSGPGGVHVGGGTPGGSPFGDSPSGRSPFQREPFGPSAGKGSPQQVIVVDSRPVDDEPKEPGPDRQLSD